MKIQTNKKKNEEDFTLKANIEIETYFDLNAKRREYGFELEQRSQIIEAVDECELSEGRKNNISLADDIINQVKKDDVVENMELY